MNTAKPSVREIFSQAIDVANCESRSAFLKQACQGDKQLRKKVEDLLAAHASAGRFMSHSGVNMTTQTADMPASAEGPGDFIGPYKLREKIGEGGFGVVYVAEQERPVCRKVAIKIIKPGMDTKQIIARFEAERQALALMDHPNVAKVLDAGTTESGRPYFAMELVHGSSITDFCDQQKLSNRERLELFIDVCHAVQHAHQKGIIHRDLKPSNIMVTMHDDKPVAKAIDFGVAKALSQRLTDKTVYTSYGQMLGTPLYMSPEQAQMSGLDVDTRSDVYSLGVLLYELLTGMTPFDKETLKRVGFDELRRMIREDDPPCPSARVSTLSAELLSTASDRRKMDQRRLCQSLRGELDWIAMKTLEKDRTRRYQSANELAKDIQHYLNDEPVTACPPSIPYRLGKFGRRNGIALISSSFVALALVLGTIVSTWQAVRATAAEADADQQRDAAAIVAQQAEQQRDSAVAAREKLRHVLYASEMNLVSVSFEGENFRRMAQLLDSTRPQAGETDIRGFEWHYWNQQLRGQAEATVMDIPATGKRKILHSQLSPDGMLLAVQYSENGRILFVIHETSTARELTTIDAWPAAEGVRRGGPMFFGPDGDWLAVAKPRTPTFGVWNTRTGANKLQFDAPATVYEIALSRDCQRVLYKFGEYRDKKNLRDGFAVFDAATRQTLYSHQVEKGIWTVLNSFSPDGKRIALSRLLESPDPTTGDTGGTTLVIVDVDSGKELVQRRSETRRLQRGSPVLRRMNPDGSRVLVRDPLVPEEFLLLDSETLATEAVLLADDKFRGRCSVAFSLDGRLLAASTSSRVYLWSLESLGRNDESKSLPFLQPAVFTNPSLAVSSDNWHRRQLRFSPGGRQLLSHLGNQITTWNIPASVLAALSWKKGAVVGGSLNRDCSRAFLLTDPFRYGGQAGTVVAWDIVSNREIWRVEESRDNRAFNTRDLSLDDKTVALLSQSLRTNREQVTTVDQISIVDANTGATIRTLVPEGAHDIFSPLHHPNGTQLAAIVTRMPDAETVTSHVIVWELATGREVMATEINDDKPQLVAFTANGSELVVARRDTGGVLFLDSQTGDVRRTIATEETRLNKFGFWSLSPDGKILGAHGHVGRETSVAVQFYDAETGKPGLRLPIHSDHAPLAMSWSHDASRLALLSATRGGFGCQITLWDPATGRLLLDVSANQMTGSNSRALRFSPDNHRLLHVASDNRGRNDSWEHPTAHPIHIWDATPLMVAAQADAARGNR